MQNTVGIGIIGCGTISPAYLKAAKSFPILDIRGLADANPEAAARRAAEFGLQPMSVDAMLADPGIEIVVNLTIPKVHVEVGMSVIAAGKHVHSEKPLGITTAEARPLLAAAAARGLRVGCAPDTFLGGAHQTCRALVDAGAIGTPVGGTAFFMCPGHERWHPAPAFYYAEGGGPMLDMGPYYITDLVNLLGPVAAVSGMTSMTRQTRTVTSQPLAGTTIPVEVTTHVAGTLRFASGAIVSIAMSFDVPKHRHLPLELYGTDGALIVPDPNFFGGQIEHAEPGGEWQPVATDHAYADGNYRIIGVADMAHAIRESRPHRASGDLAFHVLEVMEVFDRSSRAGAFVTIESRPERPAPLSIGGL
ncbi:Gfo/Idh/MocA family protein [Acidisoma sp.]|uniref:Gfo/Idh/MocA family protein n=1 Tax=Acidisoma sp. TaxID=1872115 RepID=UPI003AFFD5AD